MKKGPANKIFRKQNKNPKEQIKRAGYSDLFVLAIIVLTGVLIYSNSYRCSFHFDDIPRIVDNPAIRHLADVKAWWNYYPARPVGIFTFALNYHFNQLDVRYYHLVNLMIHLINASLVWWLTLLIFSTPTLREHPVNSQKKAIAFFTALLFVSPPLATQSVTYIVQRLTSLAALFYLLSITLYVKARLKGGQSSTNYLLFTGSLVSALLAILTKENAFTLPFAILLIEFFFIRTKKISVIIQDYRTIILVTAFLAILLIIPLRYSFSIFKPIPPSNGIFYTITPYNYLLTQFSVIVKYIQLLFLPINQNADYDFPISNTLFGIRTLLSLLFLLSLIIMGVFFYKRNRIISFGIFWFFLTLSVESGFIPIHDVIFEHRTYLPSYGFFLVLCTGVYSIPRKKYKNLSVSILVILAGIYCILTYERNTVWKDDITLWTDSISKSPQKVGPYINRGVAYGNLGAWDKSMEDYSAAIAIHPNFAKPYANRGINYARQGQWEKSITECSKAIAIDPKYMDAWYNRGVAYSNLRQWDKSIPDYTSAIGIDPKFTSAYYNRGIDYFHLEQWEKAIADFSKAIEIDPGFTNAYTNRDAAYSKLHSEKSK